MMDTNEFIMSNEPVIRLSFFLGIFAVMTIWEIIAPRRALTVSKIVRWTNNLGLVFFNSFIFTPGGHHFVKAVSGCLLKSRGHVAIGIKGNLYAGMA